MYQVLVDAARQLGPAGATVAIMQGGAKAAGGMAFIAIKDWCLNKFGTEAEVTRSIQALESRPDDPATQAGVLKAFENHAESFKNPEIIRQVSELKQFMHVPFGNVIGAQNAEKIVNAGNINTLNM